MRDRDDPSAPGPEVAEAHHLRPAQDVELVGQVLDAEGERAVLLQVVVHAEVEERVALGVLFAAPADVDVAVDLGAPGLDATNPADVVFRAALTLHIGGIEEWLRLAVAE